VELERNRKAINSAGYGLCSISYDSVDILRDFAQRRGITFPLLADPTSTIIRSFGLFNDQAKPESREYGMAHPGILLVDADGVVRGQFLEENYWNRMTMPAVFWRLGLDRLVPTGTAEREHLRVRTAASDTAVNPGSRFTLAVDIEPLGGAHVYAPNVDGGYQGLEVHIAPLPYIQVHEPVYPPPTHLRLPWTNETLSGYAGPIRMAVDVSLSTRIDLAPVIEAGQGLTLTGWVRVQACDERVCWPPETISLNWHLDLRPPDLDRVPEALQHKARAI
jgi:hypothetical protein